MQKLTKWHIIIFFFYWHTFRYYSGVARLHVIGRLVEPWSNLRELSNN